MEEPNSSKTNHTGTRSSRVFYIQGTIHDTYVSTWTDIFWTYTSIRPFVWMNYYIVRVWGGGWGGSMSVLHTWDNTNVGKHLNVHIN